jgi:hypothetical protein
MNMRFPVKNPNELAGFKQGDLIEASLVTNDDSGDAWLENFRPQRKRKLWLKRLAETFAAKLRGFF